MATEQSSIPRADGHGEAKPPWLRSVGAPAQRGSAANALAPLIRNLLGDQLPVRFELWDGSGFGPTDGPGTFQYSLGRRLASHLVGSWGARLRAGLCRR